MPKNIWTIEKIKEGFDKFYNLYGHYPTDYEINDFQYLPTPRQIQRKYGGLVSLRKILGLPISHYGTGKERSGIATESNKRGKQCEIEIYEILKKNFGEKFVHIEKPINIYDTKNRYDFYVYAKPENFAIDVLSTEGDIRSLIKIMNIKENKYRTLDAGNVELYFIYFGEKIIKERINKWLQRKKAKLPFNWKIIDVDEFKKEIDLFTPFIEQ